MATSRPASVIALALFIVLVPAALLPIHSYDFFWHLATGRWIVEHHALPLTDPFAVASDRVEWINGEWLFEVVLYAIRSVNAIAWIRAICVAALFASGFFAAARRSDWQTALVVTVFAFAGGFDRLDARPSTAAAALLVIGIVLLERELDLAYVVLTIVWINVHPSALLAPVIALLVRRVHWLPVASAAALLVNPFGSKAIAAPLRLVTFAHSGAFVNSEWRVSPILAFPLLYATVIGGVVMFAKSRDRSWRLALFALLAFLAIAQVRNQGLYFAALPLVAAGFSPPGIRKGGLKPAATTVVLTIAILAWVFFSTPHRAGLNRSSYPIDAVAQLKRTNAQGNIYNPDQFGGYLIWSFYPQRRALTDGRNELYRTFIAEYAKARTDSRAWRALLAKYDVRIAVDEYRPPLEVIDVKSGRHTLMDASLAYWPRDEWTLIAKDDVAMVFVKKTAR